MNLKEFKRIRGGRQEAFEEETIKDVDDEEIHAASFAPGA